MARLFAPGWVYLCNLRNLWMVFMKSWFPNVRGITFRRGRRVIYSRSQFHSSSFR